jgi:hypothetical protein
MKIAVAGCSVSDYTGEGVERVYGEILAESLNVEYIHEGAGIGSNYRMWRKITNLVMDDTITSDDLVIIQYTQTSRQEFWHSKYEERDEMRYMGCNNQLVREAAYGGDIIRWKPDIWKSLKGSIFAGNGADVVQTKFFQLKEEHFTSPDFDDERFKYNHYLFHNAMMQKRIKVVYVVGSGLMNGYGGVFKHLFDKNGEIHITGDFGIEKYVLDDKAHFNQLGHEYLAKTIEKQLKENKLI